MKDLHAFIQQLQLLWLTYLLYQHRDWNNAWLFQAGTMDIMGFSNYDLFLPDCCLRLRRRKANDPQEQKHLSFQIGKLHRKKLRDWKSSQVKCLWKQSSKWKHLRTMEYGTGRWMPQRFSVRRNAWFGQAVGHQCKTNNGHNDDQGQWENSGQPMPS